MFGKLLCRLGLHRWTNRKNPDGEPYVACVRCERIREFPSSAEAAKFLPGGIVAHAYDNAAHLIRTIPSSMTSPVDPEVQDR